MYDAHLGILSRTELGLKTTAEIEVDSAILQIDHNELIAASR